MTTKILRLDSSIFGAGGASTQLNEQLVESLRNRYGEVEVFHRDLAQNPLPHFTVDFVQALGKAPSERTPEENQQVALADQLIDELQQADVLVVGAPMYNFSIPSTLKTWMDYVARAGTTFQYTAAGPQGLLNGTRVFISASRGGQHKDQATDSVVPLLQNFFSLLGLADVAVIYAEGLNMGEDTRARALAEAAQAINSVAA
jgi:FMN-dependent NADH-azoreductase